MPGTDMTPDEFHGLTGKSKQWASLGVIGLLALLTLHLVLWQNPSMHKSYLDVITVVQEKAAAEIKAERDNSRLETEKSRQHGGQVGNDLSAGLRENAKAIQSLNETFIRVQERTQENQKTLIELQLKKMEQDKTKP